MSEHEVAILGVGMHPWGKWGRNFVEYGVHAAKAALADALLDVREVQFLDAVETISIW
jgi:acetyl-CoA acetyltransferase